MKHTSSFLEKCVLISRNIYFLTISCTILLTDDKKIMDSLNTNSCPIYDNVVYANIMHSQMRNIRFITRRKN